MNYVYLRCLGAFQESVSPRGINVQNVGLSPPNDEGANIVIRAVQLMFLEPGDKIQIKGINQYKTVVQYRHTRSKSSACIETPYIVTPSSCQG